MTVWPWNHAAIAYLLASPLIRWRTGDPPDDVAALAIVGGALAPDLIDKPLAWVFGVVPGGRAVAHSFLFGVPLAVLVLAVARRLDREGVGLGFGVGYLSHSPLDIVGSGLSGGSYYAGFLLWPVLPTRTTTPAAPLAQFVALSRRFLASLGTPTGLVYLTGTATLLTLSASLWWLDGQPGRRVVRRYRRQLAPPY